MRFKPYPKYKASGVEWLGEMPNGWQVRRLKRVAKAFPSNVDKKSVESEEPVRLCNYTDVYYNEEITQAMELMQATATPAQIERFTLQAGDVVITKDSETADDIGRAAYVPQDLPGIVCGYHLSMIRAGSEASGRFIKKLFDSHFVRAHLEVAAQGLTRVGLGQYELDNLAVPMPPIEEQMVIASVLDRETSKLDTLIAKQERLINLLQEKRQAMISHAVTKGLDPSVPMKDSGIEWLGMVPKYWKIHRVKSVSIFTTSGPRGWSERVGEDGSLFIQSGDLNDSLQVDFGSAKRVQVGEDAETARTRMSDGDVIVCITGAKTGNVAVCNIIPEAAYVNQHLCLIRPTNEILPTFLGLFLKCAVGQTYFEISQYGLKQGMSLGNVREAPVMLAPLDEQAQIVAFLDNATTKIDALIDRSRRNIALMREHRTALISAAVTGKIDVRERRASETT